MKAFDLFAQNFARRFLDQWPAGAPPEMRSMSRAEVEESIRLTAAMKDMPDAELTPGMVLFRDAQRAAMQESFQAFVKMGQTLLQILEEQGEDKFWQFAKTHTKIPKEDIELAMRAAQEAG
jgi:hypothetical protein